jgi:phage shock protein E
MRLPAAGNATGGPGVTLTMMNNTSASLRPLRHALRRVAIAAALVATLGTAAACSTAEAAGSAADLLPPNTVLIDVRTPAEFAEGHLDGAINMPVELPTFTAQVALLDPNLDYLVYCRTGRRAEIAIEYMDTLGFTTTNLGSVDGASSATGIRVVR